MSGIIPVIVHHETGEKPQSGGRKNQEYLKYCILQAKRFNQKVVLLGDSFNRAWCDDWHNADDFITGKHFTLYLKISLHTRRHGRRGFSSVFS